MVVQDEYPVQLGIAYLFLVGYLVRTIFVSFGLPASVGVILSGWVFSYFFQADIFVGRDLLQQLAFFLVLLTAGLEISPKDLRSHIFVMAWMPAIFEVLAITCYAVFAMEWLLIEGLVLSTVLVAIGDGLVIPKMKEFGIKFKGHPMPKLVFTWAPLEASFVLALFGILTGLSAPAGQGSVNIGLLVAANILRIVATIGAAAALGAGSGWLIPRRTNLVVNGQQMFTGSAVEAFLMVLAVALIAYGLGEGEQGHELIPMGFSPGSMFQPELLVIGTGTFFGAVVDRHVLHEVEAIMGGVWVFGQLILFSMLGSRTTTSILPHVNQVLPVVAVGLACRFVGVLAATFLTLPLRGCPCDICLQGRRRCAIQDALFCFISTLPRATIQGALGGVPLAQRFFQHHPRKHEAQDFIFTAARLYIVCMSVVGMVLLNTLGPRILQSTSARPSCNYATLGEMEDRSPGSPGDASGAVAADASPSMDQCREEALVVLADQYGLEFGDVAALLEAAALKRQASADGQAKDEDLYTEAEAEPASDFGTDWRKTLSAPGRSPLWRRPRLSEHKVRERIGKRLAWRESDLALCQFDSAGAIVHRRTEEAAAGPMLPESPSGKRPSTVRKTLTHAAASGTGAVHQVFSWMSRAAPKRIAAPSSSGTRTGSLLDESVSPKLSCSPT